MRRILVADYTLRKLSETKTSGLLFREKTALAASIDNYGADIIELPAVKSFKEDRIICRTICDTVKNSTIAIPAGTTPEQIRETWECISNAARPCLQIVLPISTVQMEYIYHLKAPKMMTKIAGLVAEAKKYCENVEFTALDATRADEGVLEEACRTAIENGATMVTVCDDAGVLMPDDAAALIKDLKSRIEVPVFLQVSNAINMATADAIYGVMAGADGVKASIAGDDCLKMGKFAQAVAAKGFDLKIETGLKLTEIQRDVNSMLSALKTEDAENIVELESTADIFLDSESTMIQVQEAAISLGYDLNEEDLGKVYESVQNFCKKKSSVGAKELEAIVASYAMQVPSTYHLESYMINSSNLSGAVAQVVLTKDGEKYTGVAGGDGPIDSSFMAIENIIGYHYELDKFAIEAVTEGKEALGSTIVRLRSNTGKLYSGNGLSTDIVGASIRAYVNALNKIVYEEN